MITGYNVLCIVLKFLALWMYFKTKDIAFIYVAGAFLPLSMKTYKERGKHDLEKPAKLESHNHIVRRTI